MIGNNKELKEKSWVFEEINAKKSGTFSILISKVPGALIMQNTVLDFQIYLFLKSEVFFRLFRCAVASL